MKRGDAYTSASQLQGLYNQLEAALLKLKACEDVEAQIKEKMHLSEHIRTAYEIQAEYLRCQDAFGNQRNHENALERAARNAAHNWKIRRSLPQKKHLKCRNLLKERKKFIPPYMSG